MNLRKLVSVSVLALLCAGVFAQKEGLKQYKLDNGLTVYLWEDNNQPNVSGRVAVRAGSIDEPAEYTGLAHYLEHMMFKGTDKIGALNWEKEKPLYEEIIKLYDEFADATDPAAREELTKKINEISMEAAQYGATDDFSNMTEGMGGEGLNAYTSYDQTVYLSDFPAFEMEKWLTINSDRFINPIFRSFQAELENVFEEYNMYQDMNEIHIQDFIATNLYKGHPYERNVIGVGEHLKNPRLSRLIEFYNTWYVPENMALILVGNFNAEQAMPLIEKTFGRLTGNSVPERQKWTETSFSANQKMTAKMSYYPQIIWGYKGVPTGDKNELLLEVCVGLLSNDMNTGLLDKLSMDGDVMAAGAELDCRRDQGRILIYAVPYFDVNQRIYETDKATEKIIFNEIEKLKNGNIEDWLIQSVKEDMISNCDLIFESPSMKSYLLTEAFVYNIDVEKYFNRKAEIMAMTKEDIVRIATQYFNTEHITLSIEEGTPKKNKLKKPSIQPLNPPTAVQTTYSQEFKQIPSGSVVEKYNNFNDVVTIQIDNNVKMFYTKNEMNDIFTMTLKYGIGTEKMPKLEYATNLMNTAGIMPNTDAQQFRRELSELGGKCTYGISDSYFTIYVQGKEENLEKICNLITRQILFPKLDDKQLDNVKGSEYTKRMMEGKSNEMQEDALVKYLFYKDKSPYLNRMKIMDVFNLQISELTGDIIRATEYALDIHYVGAKNLEEVKAILTGNLPLKEGMKSTESPIVKDKAVYDKTSVYFLPNSEVQQASIYFYVDGKPYQITDDVDFMAFNQYFSGGFSGLVMNEIREKRSMAYTAYGFVSTPPVLDKKTCVIGYVGTQSDKVADAIDVYMDLFTNMPAYPDRLENIKTYLRQSMLTDKPSFRTKSFMFDAWQRLGYTDDPAKVNMPKVNELTFDQILNFYNTDIKSKPITIIIMGDPKQIDLKRIASKYGKVNKLTRNKLFSPMVFE